MSIKETCDYCGREVEPDALRYGPAFPGPRHAECNLIKNRGTPSTIDEVLSMLLSDLKDK